MRYFCALFLCVGSYIKRRQLISSHYLCQGCVTVAYNLNPFVHRMNEWMNEWWRPVTVILTFESVDEILWCYHTNETSSAVLSHRTIYIVCSSNFWFCWWNPMVWPFKWNLFGFSLEVFVFQHFRKKPEILPKISVKGLYIYEVILIFYKFETDYLFILPRGFYITVYKRRHLTRILTLPSIKPRLENHHFYSLNNFSLKLFLSCTRRTWYKVGYHSWGLTQENLKQAA